jgi:hypothetical protein
VCAIFVLRSGELLEMDERPFDREKELQRYLAEHPDLLSAGAPEDERRRWLLVKREMGVADREEAGSRWSLDHLFVDQDATPTFVEVKRSTNTDVRRKVVGQMLEYAANASAHWDAGRLRTSFESRFEDADAANEMLAAFLEEEQDPEEFWDLVAANLDDRRLRLIFVADRIPSELRSIVEFLNEQLELTEVIAVEIKQYAEPDGNRINIVPQIIGDTEMARRVKRPGGRRRRAWNEEGFKAALRDVQEPELAERLIRLYKWMRDAGARPSWGTGAAAGVTMWLGEPGNPVMVNFYTGPGAFPGGMGGIAVGFDFVRDKRSQGEMQRLADLLRKVPGVAPYLEGLEKKEWAMHGGMDPAKVLASDEALEAWQRALSEAATPTSSG